VRDGIREKLEGGDRRVVRNDPGAFPTEQQEGTPEQVRELNGKE